MDKTVKTICPYCGTGCGILLNVEGGRVTSLAGDPDHPVNCGTLCFKGIHLIETLSAPDRLLYPQMRSTIDDPFKRVSMDDALERGASTFAGIIREHGPDAVAFYVSGQLLTEDYYVFNKLMKGFIGSNNIDSNSRLCMSSAVAAYKRAFGVDGPPACYDDIETARSLFIAGANMAYTHTMIFKRIEKARESRPDMKIVVADPRRTATAAVANLHLQLRPGTDVALFQAMLNVLIWEDMIDNDFIEHHASGFSQVYSEAMKMTPKKAAGICGLDPVEIVRAAHWFGEGPTLSLWTMGLNQSVCGTDKNNALINLHLASGQIGKPGCGPFSLTGQSNAMGGREVGGLSNLLPAHREIANPDDREEMAAFWEVDRISDRPGLTAVELFEAVNSGRVKAVWIVCTNPVVSMPDASFVERALKKAELVMVSDAFHPTDTGRLAHILLPAASWGEKEGTATNAERRISRVRQALPYPGESLPDWRIASIFAQKLGRHLGEDWSWPFGYAGPEEIFDEFRSITGGRDCDMTGIGYALLDKEGPQQWPRPEGIAGGTKRLYTDHRFHTPDGRARFVDVHYRPPAEQTDGEFPLSLITGRIRDQWHTMTRTGKVPALMQELPVPCLFINPADAGMRGIREGDLVLVRSRRGKVIAPARVTDDVREGVVFFPMHWGAMTAKAGMANTLTGPYIDPISKEPEMKHAAVEAGLFKTAWRGTVLMSGSNTDAGRRLMEKVPYGVVSCIGMESPATLVEIAGNAETGSINLEMLDSSLGLGPALETVVYSDRGKGVFKRVWTEGSRPIAARLVGGGPDDAERLRGLFLSGGKIKDIRQYLAATQP